MFQALSCICRLLSPGHHGRGAVLTASHTARQGLREGRATPHPLPWDFRARGQVIKAAVGCSAAPLNPPDCPTGRGPAQGGRQPRLGTWSGQDVAVGAE